MELEVAKHDGGPLHPEVKRFYETSFRDVNGRGVAGVGTAFFNRALEKPFPPASYFANVLELGAAHGDHLTFVRHGFGTYWLTDLENHGLTPETLRGLGDARQGRGEIRCERADAESLHYPDQTFDRVLHTCLLHHLRDPEKALREMRRVTRVGGTLSLYLPHDPGFLYSLLQRVTTGRAVKRALRREALQITPEYLRALEHPNHFVAIRALIRHVFKNDLITEKRWPLPFDSANFNLFTVVLVVRT